MIRLLIIADDFTGGLDTGVQFAAKGISTRVITGRAADDLQVTGDCEVLVAVVETRHVSAAQAHDMVYRVAQKGVQLGIPYLYKKTDSALRGNIGAELSAALKASGQRCLPFLPALPGIGRVTKRGVHYIDGVPVAESVFGRDPFEPVTESSVASLIALQSDVPTTNAAPDALGDREGVLIVDAQSDSDLRTAGQALAARDGLRVMAGCAGFAAMLPELLGLATGAAPRVPALDPGLLLICGSVNPITQRQLAFGERAGFRREHLRPEQKLDSAYFESDAGRETLRHLCQAAQESPWLIVDTNDEDISNAETSAYAAQHGMTTEDIRVRISDTLGRILPHLLEGAPPRTLLITGGDTLLQCMNHMGVFTMKPLLEVYPGVVLSQFEAGGRSRFVMSKSGGFGEETLLGDLRSLIEKQHQ